MGPDVASQASQADMSKFSLLIPSLLPLPTHKRVPKGTDDTRSVITPLVTELPQPET